MNRTESRELREQRGKIAHDMAAIANSAKQEDRDRWKSLDAEQEALRVRIEAVEKTANLNEELHGSNRPPSGQPGNTGEEVVDQEKAYRKAWVRCMQYGYAPKPHANIRGISQGDRDILSLRSMKNPFANLSEAQRDVAIQMFDGQPEIRDMLTQGGQAFPGGSGAQGGFFVPTGFVYDVEQALKYYGPMLNGGPKDPVIWETATGQPMPYPTSDDTIVTGEQLSENQQATQNDVTIGMITFLAWIYSTKLVKVSLALLQDSAFDLESYLKQQFAIRIGRILNTKLTTGAGTTEPKGIVTAATSGGTAAGAATNDGGSNEGNTIGTDDLTTLEHSVDPLYRRGAKFMFHDSTLASLKKVKDKYGRPIWMPNITVGQPDTINGYEYLVNNDMDQLQTQATSPTVARKAILFGDMTKYLVRRVKELSVMRLEERFAEFGQVAFLGFARYDGNLLDAGTHPVRYLTNNF